VQEELEVEEVEELEEVEVEDKHKINLDCKNLN
jgi:hypothetical protein